MKNSSFSHCGFKRLVLQTHKKQGLFGKEFSHIYFILGKCFGFKQVQTFIFRESITKMNLDKSLAKTVIIMFYTSLQTLVNTCFLNLNKIRIATKMGIKFLC